MKSWEVIIFSFQKGFPSLLAWSVLSKSLICILPWESRTLETPAQITHRWGSPLQSGARRNDMLGRKWLSLWELSGGHWVLCQLKGVAEDVKETVSIQRPLLLLRKSYQLEYPLPPFPIQILGCVSQTILWWDGRDGTQQCPQVVPTCLWERRFCLGLFICHCLSKSWVSTYQSKRLVAMAGPSYVSKTFSQLPFPITIFKLVMCWNISLGCLQSVLRMHENYSIIFIIDAKTRPGVQAQFSDHYFDFSMLTLYCVLMKLS